MYRGVSRKPPEKQEIHDEDAGIHQTYSCLVVRSMDLVFPYIGNNPKLTFGFFRGGETTNQPWSNLPSFNGNTNIVKLVIANGKIMGIAKLRFTSGYNKV